MKVSTKNCPCFLCRGRTQLKLIKNKRKVKKRKRSSLEVKG